MPLRRRYAAVTQSLCGVTRLQRRQDAAETPPKDAASRRLLRTCGANRRRLTLIAVCAGIYGASTHVSTTAAGRCLRWRQLSSSVFLSPFIYVVCHLFCFARATMLLIKRSSSLTESPPCFPFNTFFFLSALRMFVWRYFRSVLLQLSFPLSQVTLLVRLPPFLTRRRARRRRP